MKNTDKNATKAKRSLMARLAELFGFRRERSLTRSEHGSRHRAAEAGNVFFTLFGAVAVVGVLGAGIMSTMRGPLTTMVEVNRIEETKAQLRLNARLILADAGGANYCGATDDGTAIPGSVEFTEPPGFTGAVTLPGGEGGGMPSIGGTITDPWGQTYGYCAYNKGADNSTTCTGQNYIAGDTDLNTVVIALISSGPDRIFQTSCSDAFGNTKIGDDIIEPMTYTEAVTGSGGLWSIDSGDPNEAEINKNIEVQGSGSITGNLGVTGTTSFTGASTFGNNVTAVGSVITGQIEAPSGAGDTINIVGDVVGDSVVFSGTADIQGNIFDSLGNVTINDDLDIVGNTDITGTLDVSSALDVNGSITDTSDNVVTVDDALSVTGAADITGNFAVNTNMFTVDATTGDTVVAGTADLNGKTIIRGDGTDDTTNALEIWNAAATPLELMSVDDAGNMAIAGRLLTGGFDETVSIYGTTTDGSTDPLVIYDGAATPVPVFSVNTDGEITIDGAVNGDLLIATGTEFSPVAMSGDATISSAGVIDLAAGAVENDEIADGAVDTDELADGAVTGAKIGLGVAGAGTYDCLKLDGSNIVTQACGSGGGGDGVGTDGFTDLADTPAAYAASAADADKLVVVNPTGDGLVFADAATIVPPADRLEDRADTANSKPIDTYIDVDTSDDGADNSIVFVNDGTQNLVLTATGGLGYRIDPPVAGDIHLHEPGTYMSLAMTNGNVGATASDGMEMGMGSTVFNFALKENLPMQFWTNTLQRLRIDAGGGVGIGSAASADNDPSALFEMGSTTQGFLAPRLTNAQATTLAAVPPATGLLIFNTEAGDNGIFQFWDGSAWVDVGGGGAATGGLWEPDGSNDYIEYDDTLGGVRIGRVTGQPAPATDWLLDVTNSVVYTTANKVGINSTTISPGLNLDITGNVGATNYCDQDGADCFSAGDIATLAGGGGGKWLDGVAASDIYYTGGDVGISTNDPLGLLHINGTPGSLAQGIVFGDGDSGIYEQSDDNMRINLAGTDRVMFSTSEIALLIGNSPRMNGAIAGGPNFTPKGTDPDTGLGQGAAGADNTVSLFTAGSERLFIDPAGLIGIGNALPQTRLDITGTIRIGDGSELCNVAGHEGAMRYVAASDTYQVCADSATGWEDLFSTGTGAAGLWTDVGGNRIHYGATGFERVGIATTNPITTLDVNGGVRIGSVSGNAPTYLSLNSLSNVDAAAPANNQVLTYNSGSGNWEPYSSSSLVNSVVLNDISNVNVPSPSDGDVLSYDTATSRWVAVSSVPSADTLAGLSCNANELARWNGTAWVCSSETNVDASLSLQFTATAISSGSWSQNGGADSAGLDFSSAGQIVLLDANTMAVSNHDTLTTFTYNGSNWTEVSGARLTVASGIQLNMVRLSSNAVARNAGNGSAGTVTAYTWNGSNWTSAGTAPGSYFGALTMMNSNTMVNIDNLANTIRVYTWNGSAFTQIGSAINLSPFGISGTSKYRATRLSDDTIVMNSGADFYVLRWNGSTWSQVGNTFASGVDPNHLINGIFLAHDSTTLTVMDGTTALETFSFNGTDWVSAGNSSTGIFLRAGVLRDTNSAWVLNSNTNSIRRFDFAASVVGATVVDTNATGQLDSLLNIGDRFLVSRTSLNNQVFTVANIPNADTLQLLQNASTEGPVNADITKITNLPNTLNDISDVDVSSPSNNDCLLYNNSTNNWEAGSCDPNGLTQEWTDDGSGNIYNTDGGNVGIGTSSPGNKLTVSGDVRSNSIILNGAAGDAPTYTTPNLALNDLNNVAASSPTTNDVLAWNGSAWINTANAGGLWSENGSDIYFNTGGVGIGTNAPGEELEIHGTDPTVEVQDTDAAANGNTGGGFVIRNSINQVHGRLGYLNTTYLILQNNIAGGDLRLQTEEDIIFRTNSAERARIDPNGYLGINETSPNVHLDVNGSIEYTGTLADVSDIRLKKDIKPLDTDDMIQRIMNVDTYTFVMKDDEAGQVEYGVMAQEIEKIFPELVRTANDDMGTKSVNYVGLIAPMIEATKSLKAENEALKAEIAEIKTAQAGILEEVKGIARHTGYGMEKGDMMYLFAAMMIMMLSGFGLAHMYRRKGSGNKE